MSICQSASWWCGRHHDVITMMMMIITMVMQMREWWSSSLWWWWWQFGWWLPRARPNGRQSFSPLSELHNSRWQKSRGEQSSRAGCERKLILKDDILGWKTRLTMGMMIWWELGWGLAEWWEIYIWWYDDVNIWRMVIFWYDETMTWWYDERAALGLAEWWEIPRCINWGFASGAFRFSPHTISCLSTQPPRPCFYQVQILLHSDQTCLNLHTRLLPPNQPYHAWKLYHGFRNVQTLMESFQFKPTHSCFHCVIFINHPIHVLEKHTALC